MMHEMLSHIQSIYENRVKGPKMSNQIEILLEGVRSKQYQPLMTRTRCGKLTKLQHQYDIFYESFPFLFTCRKFGKSNNSLCQEETN